MWSEFNSQARKDKYRLSDAFSQKPEEAGIIICLLFNFFVTVINIDNDFYCISPL